MSNVSMAVKVNDAYIDIEQAEELHAQLGNILGKRVLAPIVNAVPDIVIPDIDTRNEPELVALALDVLEGVTGLDLDDSVLVEVLRNYDGIDDLIKSGSKAQQVVFAARLVGRVVDVLKRVRNRDKGASLKEIAPS